MTGEARGYSWPTFGPDNPGVPAPLGNTRSLQHGAYSARSWKPLADAIAAELADIAPWCTRAVYGPAVAAWARTEAQLQLVMAWLDDHGPLDKDGEPRPATALLSKLETQAQSLRAELGLSPLALARLLGAFTTAVTVGGDDAGALDALRAEGRRFVEARETAPTNRGEEHP